jgi:hypothetical protein
MKATLELEFIGANSADFINSLCGQFDLIKPGLGEAVIGRTAPGPWVAEITGKYPSGKLKRSFVRSKRDYSRANSKGSRGVYLWFILESDKLYEVHARTSWARSTDYFCAITTSGDVYTLSDEEVSEWLSSL